MNNIQNILDIFNSTISSLHDRTEIRFICVGILPYWSHSDINRLEQALVDDEWIDWSGDKEGILHGAYIKKGYLVRVKNLAKFNENNGDDQWT